MVEDVRIVPNHKELRKFLKEDPWVKSLVKEQADKIDALLGPVIAENSALCESQYPKVKLEKKQGIFNEEIEPSDRMRVRVSIEYADNSDFLFDSIKKAVEKAGGLKLEEDHATGSFD